MELEETPRLGYARTGAFLRSAELTLRRLGRASEVKKETQ